jgi:hypothetical protein
LYRFATASRRANNKDELEKFEDNHNATFDTSGGCIFKRINRHRDRIRARWGIWQGTDLWCALTEICPFM